MARKKLHQIKKPYINLIDLIASYRLEELGKTGPILIPKQEIDLIAEPADIQRFLEQLESDRCIKAYRLNERKTLSALEEVDGVPHIKLVCSMSASEITNYKKSLLNPSSQNAIQFHALSWEEVQIRFISKQNVMVTTEHDPQTQTDYIAMGFENHKKHSPNTAWHFLYGLSFTGGEFSGRLTTAIKKQKQLLSDQLKGLFDLQTDPFLSHRRERCYKICIHLVPPVEDD